MNKEYFVAKDKLVVMDEQGNIDIRNRMNNPKEILEQENVLEEKIKGREDLILDSFPEAILKKQKALAKEKDNLQKYINRERKISEVKTWSNIIAILGGFALFSSQPFSEDLLIDCVIGGLGLATLNAVLSAVQEKVALKQEIYIQKEKYLEGQLLNYQNNLSKIKKEAYSLNSDKEVLYLTKETKDFKENDKEKIGVIYEILPSSKDEESEKKKLVERRKLLQNLAALSKKNPDFSLEEIIQNSPELTKENKELCLKLVKKDL